MGPYVTAFLVLVAILVTKFKRWGFDGAGSNSGFKWLLHGDVTDGVEMRNRKDGGGVDWRRESQERLMRDTKISFLELEWGEQPMEICMRVETEKIEMKRSRSF